MLKNLLEKIPTMSAQKIIFIATVYFATVLDLSFWRFVWNTVEVTNFTGVIFAISLPFFIFLTLWMFFNLIFIKYIGKFLLCTLLIVSAAANYAMFTYGIFIDSDMYRNVVETDINETMDLLTFKSFIWVLLIGVLPAFLLTVTHVNYMSFIKEAGRRALNLLIALALLGGFAACTYKEYASYGRNYNEVRKLINTFNYIYATGRYYQRESLKYREFVTLDYNPSFMRLSGNEKRVLVVVLGETARAADFSLYGYEKETNPMLKAENPIVFKNVASCGTATAVSVPCMFSHMNRDDFNVNDAKFTQNVLDIALSAGYSVSWLENNSGCKGVCNRIPTEDLRASDDPKWCKGGYCYDEILLDGLDEKLQNLKYNSVIVLHMMGSHGPSYFERYPDKFKKFQPTCDTADLQDCTREQIVNTYDNTILYTDYVVANVIEKLKAYPQYQSAMLYISDHGESLGENNIYLHGLPYKIAPDYQKQVPMILWLSDKMAESNKINVDILRQKAETSEYSHDNFFHTLIGLTDIKTTVYKRDMDLMDM